MTSSCKYQKSLLAMALSMVTVPSVYAADQNAATNYDRIAGETVVVTAARTQKALLDTDASMSVVTTKETQLLNRDSVPELLSTQPGIHILSDGTPGAKRVAIRGEDSTRTLIAVNGERISDQKTKSGAPMLMNPYFIERIEVVKGPASVLYGSDAMGGIVNVITKKPSDKPFAVEGGLGFNSASSSFTEFINATGTVDRFKYAVGAFNDNAGDLRIADNERVENTSYNARGANADLSYDVTDNVTIGYNGELYYSDSEVSTTTDGVFKDFRGDMPKWDRMKHKLYFSAVDLNDYVASVDASVYYQTNDKKYSNQPMSFLNIQVDNEQESYGANLQTELTLSDRVRLIAGYDGRIDKIAKSDSTTEYFGSVHRGPDIKFATDDAGYKQQSHALYTLLSTDLTDEFTVNAGVRYNYIKSFGGTTYDKLSLKFGPANMGPFDRQHDNEDTSFNKLIGSLGVVYRPFEHGAFRANWSQGFRAPTLQEMYITTYSAGVAQKGNPKLDPEESNNYELGFRWDDGALITDFAVFYTKSKNYIDTFGLATSGGLGGRPSQGGLGGGMPPLTPDMAFGMFDSYMAGKGGVRQFGNVSDAETYGAELSLSYLIDNTYEPYMNLTYLNREYKHNGQTSSNVGVPKLSGNAGLRFHGDMLSVDTYARFASKSDHDDIAGTSYIGKYHLHGYVTWNLAVSTDFGTNDMFSAYAAVENIFDTSYMVNELIDEPGRSFSVGVRGQF